MRHSIVFRFILPMLMAAYLASVGAQEKKPEAKGIRVGTYEQEVATSYTTRDGLPSNDVIAISILPDGTVRGGTAAGMARFSGGSWSKDENWGNEPGAFAIEGPGGVSYSVRGDHVYAVVPGSRFGPAPVPGTDALNPPLRGARAVAAGRAGELAVAADSGLYLRMPNESWRAIFPRDGSRSWAPVDVRGVAFDSQGRLWFASPQGIGRLDAPPDKWKLISGLEGLPYDDFTCVAAGENGVVWFGTRLGAIRYDGKTWEYRQGRRWLPHDEVRAITVDPRGNAWIATAGGVGLIERRPTTLAEKAKFFEEEIDRRHRRTPYEYVRSVYLARPGDKSEWTQFDSDNDGLWTAMYGAGECFAYAAGKSEEAKRRAKKAFEALRFLGEVTQGGEHPAPRGFVARSILPTSGPDPNAGRLEGDKKDRAERDSLWKVISPRWPKSADGKWYWKSDTSSDELDGHFFFYARYYDLVAETDAEKRRVREVVTGIADHLIDHGFSFIDHDGKPTRWGKYGPQSMNHDKDWWEDRGLDSLSIISYLRVAEHVSGDKKYADAAGRLITEHGYAMNAFVPKVQVGMGTANQSDDEMAFMNFYNLMSYERDPELRQIWGFSFMRYWRLEEPELNPLFNFMFAASCSGEVFRYALGRFPIAPRGSWLEDSVDMLKRYPFDRVEWAFKNSHRHDIVPLNDRAPEWGQPGRGYRRNGKVLPIDERFVEHWNHDPWRLDAGGDGRVLADGASFLLPYYMGVYHGFILGE